jgi:type VI secretion system secreted protein Hcp
MSFEAYIKIDGIEGESTDSKHEGWIELLGYDHSAAQPTSGSESSGGYLTTGKVELSKFKLVKTIDLATPVIYKHCTNATPIPTITMEVCRAAGDKEVYYTVVLTNCVVTSIQNGGTAKGAKASPLPIETVEVGYAEIKWTYTQTDHATGAQGGVTEASWNVTTNVSA